jgi:hypothetical protein
MPKEVPATQLNAVLKAVAAVSAPASLEEVAGKLPRSLPRRTLQRRLARLVAEGRLAALSARAGRRYQLPRYTSSFRYGESVGASPVVAEPPPSPAGSELAPIRLSAAARDIKRRVTRSVTERKPVGYDIAFLDGYRPNVSAYLPLTLRRKLAHLGRTDGEALPAGTYLRKVLDRLLIDLSWNSSRLEGNTYSLLETQRLLEAGEAAEGKAARETQMILNHKAAIELLAEPHRADSTRLQGMA